MCSTDEGSAVFCQTRVGKARKARTCYECNLPIPVGAPYIRTMWINERGDKPGVAQVHVGCDALSDFVRTEICEAHGEFGFIPVGGLDVEIDNLNEYGAADVSERDDLLALGFEFTLDDGGDPDDAPTARDVAWWLWDIVKAEYREVRP